MYKAKDITMHIINLQCYNMILGKLWLYFTNPVIDWQKNMLTFNYGKCIIQINASKNTHSSTTCNSVYVFCQQFATVFNNVELYAICNIGNQTETNNEQCKKSIKQQEKTSPKVETLLKEY